MTRTTKRIIAVFVAFLLIAVGAWFYAYSSMRVTQRETYQGPIRLTSMTIDEAKHLKHKFRVRRVAKHVIHRKAGKQSRSVGACYTDTAHLSAGHLLLMNVVEVWAQFHWCQKRNQITQIALAKVQSVRTDTCCMLNPWEFDKKELAGGRYWDGSNFSEVARKVVYVTFLQKLGPIGLTHKTFYIDCRLNALHGWFACHMAIGDEAPNDWNPWPGYIA